MIRAGVRPSSGRATAAAACAYATKARRPLSPAILAARPRARYLLQTRERSANQAFRVGCEIAAFAESVLRFRRRRIGVRMWGVDRACPGPGRLERRRGRRRRSHGRRQFGWPCRRRHAIRALPARRTSADGAPCPALNLACGFGDSPRPECRHLWSCTNQGWREAQGSCADLTSFCPAAQPDGSVCTPINDPSQNGYCAYAGDVLCLCPCVGTRACGPGNWVCHSPPTTDGCPATAPNLGSACSAQGLQCSYGDPCDGYGTDLYCRAGTWQHGFVACTTR
jgi:hypothetical protein